MTTAIQTFGLPCVAMSLKWLGSTRSCGNIAGKGERAVALFDGSLTVSFAGGLPEEVRSRYRGGSSEHAADFRGVPRTPYCLYRSVTGHVTSRGCSATSMASVSPMPHSSVTLPCWMIGTVTWMPWRLTAFLCQRQDVTQDGNYTDNAKQTRATAMRSASPT